MHAYDKVKQKHLQKLSLFQTFLRLYEISSLRVTTGCLNEFHCTVTGGVILDLDPICQMPEHQESDSLSDFSDSVILAIW